MLDLYYWPGLPGRGEFVRLVLEEAGVPWRDVGRIRGFGAVAARRSSAAGFAPPYLVDGDLTLAQTPAICLYLGRMHGLLPDDPAGEARALQLLLTVADVVSEVHDTHHPISVALRYEDQREPARLRAAAFLDGRLAKWLAFFERALGEGPWLLEDFSVADLALFQLLEGLAYAFPRGFAAAAPPTLLAHRDRVAARPNIAAYLTSERRQAFNEDGIFRRYPELDLSAESAG